MFHWMTASMTAGTKFNFPIKGRHCMDAREQSEHWQLIIDSKCKQRSPKFALILYSLTEIY